MSTSRSSEMKLGKRKSVNIDAVIPYWRNPRIVSEESIGAVAESIKLYGYQQPIVVDESNVIIAGHTRYAAARKLGITKIEVMVAEGLSEQQVKQLRLIDNRAGEFTRWDFNKLVTELEGLDMSTAEKFFPEIAVEEGWTLTAKVVEDADDDTWLREASSDVEFVCPECFHNWFKHVTREDVLSGRIVGEDK